MSANGETGYERDQRANALVAWLHSLRYRRILRVVDALAATTAPRPLRVVEIGCAHAKLFSLLDARWAIDYTGIEPETEFAAAAQTRYGQRRNFRLVRAAALDALGELAQADIVVALETFEHMPEHEVVRVIEAIRAARPALLVCSVPIEIGPALWIKNLGSLATGYKRHREYRWRETLWAGLYRLDHVPAHGTGHRGFDWRWLAQTVRHNFRIVELRKLPFGWLPAALAFSVFIVAEPRPTDAAETNPV